MYGGIIEQLDEQEADDISKSDGNWIEIVPEGVSAGNM